MEPGRELDGLTVDQWGVLEELGRALQRPGADLAATLTAIVEVAVRVVPAAEHASVSLCVRGRFEPQVVTGEVVEQLDAYELLKADGPRIRASVTQQVVVVRETLDEPRWRELGRRAAELGIRSLLVLPLAADEVRLGALCLFAAEPDAFSDYDVRVAGLGATYAALALAGAQAATNLRNALVNRDVIGMAKGILIERRRITADAAFSLLVARSQRTGRKLADVAARVVETGALDLDGDVATPA